MHVNVSLKAAADGRLVPRHAAPVLIYCRFSGTADTSLSSVLHAKQTHGQRWALQIHPPPQPQRRV